MLQNSLMTLSFDSVWFCVNKQMKDGQFFHIKKWGNKKQFTDIPIKNIALGIYN